MKLLFVWLLGYYCVDVTCYQLHQPVESMEECQYMLTNLAKDFKNLDEEYEGKWELNCHTITNRYVGLS